MKKTAAIFLLLCSIMSAMANTIEINPDTLISNLHYDYEITSGYYENNYTTMCEGTLSMSIEVPETVECLVLQRAKGPTVKFLYPPFYNVRRTLDIVGKSCVEVEVQNVKADTYFRIDCLIGNTHYYSSHFAVNDLISPEDLVSLRATSPTLGIVSKDMQASKKVSAYLPHEFILDNEDFPITDPKWTLTLPLENGDFETINLKDDNLSCTTEALDFSTNFKADSDGLMEAQLKFSGLINDTEVSSEPLDIIFDLKPFIEYAEIEKIEDEAPNRYYSAYYKVKYYGSDYVRVCVKEEFGSDVRVTCINEPLIATGCAKNIKSSFYTWIDFEVENKYGNDKYTIELLPNGEIGNGVENIEDDLAGYESGYKAIEVYDTNGKKIADVDAISDAYALPVKGILIVRLITNSGQTKTHKILNH